MSTAFSRVTSAVMAMLQASPPVCRAIYRARSGVIPDKDDEAITVQWAQGLPRPGAIATAPIDWQTTITVECYARSTTESGDVAVDPLLEKVYERLASNPTLGGMVDDLVIAGIEAENTAEGRKTGWVRLTYVAEHRTDNQLLS